MEKLRIVLTEIRRILQNSSIFRRSTTLFGSAEAIRQQIGTWYRENKLQIPALYLAVTSLVVCSFMLSSTVRSILSIQGANLAGFISQEASEASNDESRRIKELHILTTTEASKSNHNSLEHKLIKDYAREHQLTPVWIAIQDSKQLFSYQQNKKAEFIVSELEGLNSDMAGDLKFTLPWAISTQQVVVRTDTNRMDSIGDILTRSIAIKRSSPVWPMLESLAKQNQMMSLIPISEDLSIEQVLDRISSGHYDITVQDSLVLENRLPKYLDLDIAFNMTDDRVMTWAISSSAEELRASLDQFLYKKHLELDVSQFYREDLPGLKNRKLLRLITYYNPVTYYVDKGVLKGFEYELAKRFAKDNNMRLQVVVANSRGEMAELLLQGKGDVIAASLSVEDSAQPDQISYSDPYNYSAPVIVGRTFDSTLLDPRNLQDRRIALPAESPYRGVLRRVIDSGINFEMIHIEPGQSLEETLLHVETGKYDLTVIDGNQLKAGLIGHRNLKAHFPISDPMPHSWVVRQSDTQLLVALNKFIKKEYRKAFYNVLIAKYIENPFLRSNSSLMLAEVEKLSPYDEIVHKYAEQYSFDWRLIVAQMYQESQFDPDATSDAGAEGLMQLIPDTADLMGIKDTADPDSNIRGGTRYLAYLRDRFERDLLMEDRLWFSLAAYNAGYNRVKMARQLAEKMNLDKDRWFDNVEKAMLALSKPYRKNGKLIRYCRCGQTTIYVREIKTLYSNYVRLSEVMKLASTDLIPAKGS